MHASETPSAVLYGISASPWTAKASFALEWAGVAHRFAEHTPMLGERRLRRLSGVRRPTVPLLEHPGTPAATEHAVGPEQAPEVTMGSLAIAHFANRHGRAPGALIPDEHEQVVCAWDARAERLIDAARALLLERMLQSPEALRENVPRFVPESLRGLMRPAARMGVSFIAKKHGVRSASPEQLRVELEALRDALHGAAARDTLLAEFSYADIAMACALNALCPTHKEPRARAMGPGMRACWTSPELVAEYPELFAWRERIYERHREPLRAISSEHPAVLEVGER